MSDIDRRLFAEYIKENCPHCKLVATQYTNEIVSKCFKNGTNRRKICVFLNDNTIEADDVMNMNTFTSTYTPCMLLYRIWTCSLESLFRSGNVSVLWANHNVYHTFNTIAKDYKHVWLPDYLCWKNTNE